MLGKDKVSGADLCPAQLPNPNNLDCRQRPCSPELASMSARQHQQPSKSVPEASELSSAIEPELHALEDTSILGLVWILAAWEHIEHVADTCSKFGAFAKGIGQTDVGRCPGPILLVGYPADGAGECAQGLGAEVDHFQARAPCTMGVIKTQHRLATWCAIFDEQAIAFGEKSLLAPRQRRRQIDVIHFSLVIAGAKIGVELAPPTSPVWLSAGSTP